MKLTTKLFIGGLLIPLFFIAACKPREPKPATVYGVYTIWVGSAAFSSGYQADNYQRDDGLFVFINKRSGKKEIVPECKVLRIETN